MAGIQNENSPLVENNMLAYICLVYHKCRQEALIRTVPNHFDAAEILKNVCGQVMMRKLLVLKMRQSSNSECQ